MRPDNNLFKKFLKKGAVVITAMALMTTMSAINARSVDESWFEEFEGIQIQVVSIWGDANYDNMLGSDDASQVLSTYAKNATGLASGYNGREDVNFDGIANSVDASLILEQYAKVSTGRLEKLLDQGGVFIELPYGRTFSGIAVEEGMSMEELHKLNPELENINDLPAGQKIYVMRYPFFFEEEETTATTSATKTVTTKPTTIATTATSTTKKITTTTTATVAIVTDTPVTNTKPVTVFLKDHTYKLAPGFTSWTLYSDVSGSNVCGTLYENQLIKISEVGTMYKGVLEDGTEGYFRVYSENFHQWVEVTSSVTSSVTSTATEKSTTTTTSTTIKIFVGDDYNPQWHVRKEAGTWSDSLGYIKRNEEYVCIETSENGWEKVIWKGQMGFIGTAGFEHLFVTYDPDSPIVTTATIRVTTILSTTTTITTKQSTTKSTTIQPTTSTTIKKVFVGDEYNPFWRIRSAPTTSSKELCKIYAGQEYQYFSIENGWEKVMFNGVYGYIGTSDFEYLFSVYDPNNPINTTPVVTPSEGAFPESVLSVIRSVQSQYPNAKISASAYDLSGRRGYTYNGYTPLYAGCSLKAAYATFVLKQCEARGIDISKYCLEYREGMKNTGSGDLQYSEYGTMFTVGYLIDKLIIISDNTAYNILLSEFPMWEYKQWLNAIGGQQNIAAPYQLYGSASSRERVNEWVHVWNYLSTGSTYANRLRYNLSVASPNFLGANVLHKSGSCDQWDYTCASDSGVVNGSYILAIVVQDAESENGSANAVRSIANAIRSWVASNNIF